MLKEKQKNVFTQVNVLPKVKKLLVNLFWGGMKVLCIFMLMGDYWVVRFSFFLLSFNKSIYIFERYIRNKKGRTWTTVKANDRTLRK
ncbi:hypothetical protein C4E24_05685 [ANME-1 cluster archaeon AG-394-G21]|nr:hypothetical protein [ANME-1 cluster archaeon AG-394-G21]